jgi:transposase
MGTHFVAVDRCSPILMPPSLQDWLPEGHIARFIVDITEGLPFTSFRINWKGTGSAQFPPSMMLALLVYCYSTGRFSSRVIEDATYTDVAVRFITGDTHPDHDTICRFRRENRAAFREAFVKVLAIAGQSGLVKKVGAVSVDGTKIKANASKHAAVSYERAGRLIEQLTLEVEQLERKAEEADSTPLEDGLSLSGEISRREDRKAALQEARRVIEQKYEQEHRTAQEEYKKKLAEREAKREAGKRPGGRPPKPPSETPPGNRQHNFTDPDSSIMKAGNGQHFEQAYNAQAGVDCEGSMLILGTRVSSSANDKKELKPTVDSIDSGIRKPSDILVDSGYFSEKQVEAVEGSEGPTVYAATGKKKHGRTVADLEKHSDPPPPADDASLTERMKHRLCTQEGREKYKVRKETVEPVFGIIKHAMGFRQFHLRGHPKVELEWQLVCLAYNCRRLFTLAVGRSVAELCAEIAIKA